MFNTLGSHADLAANSRAITNGAVTVARGCDCNHADASIWNASSQTYASRGDDTYYGMPFYFPRRDSGRFAHNYPDWNNLWETITNGWGEPVYCGLDTSVSRRQYKLQAILRTQNGKQRTVPLERCGQMDRCGFVVSLQPVGGPRRSREVDDKARNL